MNKTSLDRTSDTEIVITRFLRASPRAVFRAYTEASLVARWWAPASRGVKVIECTAEVRPEGRYRYVVGGESHGRFAFSGRYLEVVEPSRLVYTQSFEPMPEETTVTVTFEARDGGTWFVSHEVYPSKAILDQVLSTGMADGMRETFEQLDALVASLET